MNLVSLVYKGSMFMNVWWIVAAYIIECGVIFILFILIAIIGEATK